MPSLKIFALSLLFHTYKILYISNYIKYSKGLASPPRSLPLVGGRRFTSLRWDASPFEYFMVKCKLAIGGLKAIEKDNRATRKD
jgi:hypothetical protein